MKVYLIFIHNFIEFKIYYVFTTKPLKFIYAWFMYVPWNVTIEGKS